MMVINIRGFFYVEVAIDAGTTINRQDFGVGWNASMDKGGIVVGDMVEITIDVEAILDSP